MKNKFVIIIASGLSILLFACKKQSAVLDNNLYGKWKLVKIYNEWHSPGTDGWQDVSGEEMQQLEFNVDGHYEKIDSSSSLFQQCSGTYQMPAIDKVVIKSTCDPATETLKITELTNENLIVDKLGTEGLIRYKYKLNIR